LQSDLAFLSRNYLDKARKSHFQKGDISIKRLLTKTKFPSSLTVSSNTTASSSKSGTVCVARILAELPLDLQETLLSKISNYSSALADEIHGQMYSIEPLLHLEQSDLKAALRTVPPETIASALHFVDRDIAAQFINLFPPSDLQRILEAKQRNPLPSRATISHARKSLLAQSTRTITPQSRTLRYRWTA
jgi:flagellar motor switch protein FliG